MKKINKLIINSPISEPIRNWSNNNNIRTGKLNVPNRNYIMLCICYLENDK